MQSTNPKVKGLKRILSQKPTEFMHFKKLLRIQMIDLVVTIMFVLAVVCEQLVQPDARNASPDLRLRSLSSKWTDIDTPLKVIMSIETLCTLWITTFLILRFYWREDRTKFAKSFMAIMDSFVVMSYFVTLILFELEAYLKEKSQDYDQHRFFTIYRVMACLRMIKLFRMVHVFNLARYNALFFSLGMAVKDSLQDLAVIFMFIFFCIVAYATCIFWVEFDFQGNSCLEHFLETEMENLEFNVTIYTSDANGTSCNFTITSDDMEKRKFNSIFACMWWSLITITTVGYGDMVPTSTIGKIIGACCACSGVPLIAIPLPIISQKFDVYYRRYCKRMEKRSTRKDNERLGDKWVSYLDRPFFDTDRYMADVIDDAGPAWNEKRERRV